MCASAGPEWILPEQVDWRRRPRRSRRAGERERPMSTAPPLPPSQLVSSFRGGTIAATASDRRISNLARLHPTKLGRNSQKSFLRLSTNRRTRGWCGKRQLISRSPKKTWTATSSAHNNMCDTLQLNWKLGACQAGNSSAHRQVGTATRLR